MYTDKIILFILFGFVYVVVMAITKRYYDNKLDSITSKYSNGKKLKIGANESEKVYFTLYDPIIVKFTTVGYWYIKNSGQLSKNNIIGSSNG